MKTQTDTVVAGLAGDRLLPVGAVAAILNVSPRSLWKMLYSGKLPTPVRLGRSVKWRLTDVQAFIARGCRVEEGR
jgi:predicted DNA-binding transcriptional regulator AlpA